MTYIAHGLLGVRGGRTDEVTRTCPSFEAALVALRELNDSGQPWLVLSVMTGDAAVSVMADAGREVRP